MSDDQSLAGFWAGLTAPWHGLTYMARHPALWRYGVVPVLVNLLITLIVLVLLVAGAVAFAVYLHPRLVEAGWGAGWEVLAVLGLLVLALGLAAATWALLGGILAGHYYTRLAEEVERQLGIAPEELREVSLAYQTLDALRDFAVLLAVNSGLLLAGCVPIVGPPVALCGALYFDSSVMGREFLDFPLALRGVRRKEKREFFRRHRGATLGLGAAVLAANLVPVFGAVLLTTAVSGGVLLHRRLAGAERVSSGIGEDEIHR